MKLKKVTKHVRKKPVAVPKSKRIKSGRWKCSNCSHIYEFSIPQSVPAPCKVCESIFFQTDDFLN